MGSKRKIIVTEFYTLDGLMSDPSDQMEWVLNSFSPDLGEYEDKVYDQADTLLLGRVTYKIFESYWPNAVNDPDNPDIQMAHKINDISKIVFSKSLQSVEWKNTRILRDIVPEEINAIKQEEGKDILIVGSADIVQQFTNHGLIDEYHLMLHPVVLGTGKPLFKNINQKNVLKLMDTKKFQNGVVGLFYEISK